MNVPGSAGVNPILEPLGVFGIALAALLATSFLIRKWLYRRATQPESYLRACLDATRVPSILWCLAGATYAALRLVESTAKVELYAGRAVLVFLTLSFSLVLASALVRMLAIYGRKQGTPYAAVGLSRTLIYVVTLGLGLTIVLRVMGVSVTPMLTVLGVGGLAVGLALQDTLANFFAGIHLMVESPVDVGDFIRLSSGEEGIVSDIGWRTTRVTTMQNNTIVIPNTKITSSILINYSLPDKRLATDIDIVVAHEADLDLVRRMVLEEVAQVPDVLDDPEPMVMMDPGVTPTHIQLKVWVHIPERTLQGLVRSAIRFRLVQRFQREGVPLPKMDYVVTGPPIG